MGLEGKGVAKWATGREDTGNPGAAPSVSRGLLLTPSTEHRMYNLIDGFPRQLKEALEIGRKAN
jgi:hypothetical protein